MDTTEKQEQAMPKAEPQKEHEWLQKLVGEWDAEIETGPDQTSKGTENVRSIGGLWTMGEGRGEMPDGSPAITMMTLGYDPQKGKFVGTFIGSMMTYLWVYEGDLEGNKLTLNAEGPKFGEEGMAKYRDVVEFVSNDHRTLTSYLFGDDGEWTKFMTAHYRRK